jgi:ABC-2 type transport system permease protein
MINIKNIITVAKREYFTIVKKKSFWISTLLLPLAIIVIGYISGYSSQQAQKNFEEVKQFDKGTQILILDETKNLPDVFFDNSEVFIRAKDKNTAIEEVKNNQVDAFFYYPEGIFTGNNQIEIYRQNENIIENSSYNAAAISIISQSVLSDLTQEQLAVTQGSISAEVTAYENGQIKEGDFTRLIVPGLGIIIYFLMVVFGINYLLSSVSEEKESRMIEILLTSISSRSLLIGKLIGLLGVILTQMLLLSAFAVIGFMIVKSQINIPFSFSDLVFDPIQIVYAVLCIILGFLVLASVMVGVGSAMPSLKEAQSFSSMFMILTIFPLYFAGILVSDPDSTLAKVLSFVPITAPLVLLFRNAFNVITPLEMGLSLVALIVQLIISVYLAVKLFEIGSLEYKEKISLDRVWKVIKD